MTNIINISLNTLKEIVKKADEELGGTNGTVHIGMDTDSNQADWSTKEKYYKHKLSLHRLTIESDTFYEDKIKYSQIK